MYLYFMWMASLGWIIPTSTYTIIEWSSRKKEYNSIRDGKINVGVFKSTYNFIRRSY